MLKRKVIGEEKNRKLETEEKKKEPFISKKGLD